MRFLTFKARKEQINEYFICIFLILLICIDFELPDNITNKIDSLFGYFIFSLFGFSMFFTYDNPLVGLLSLLFIFKLLSKCSKQTGNVYIKKHIPSEKKKYKEMMLFNPEPYEFNNLEEEMISNIKSEYNEREINNENVYLIFLSNHQIIFNQII